MSIVPALMAQSLAAQAVRGHSLSQVDSTPVAGVVMQLLSASGDVVTQRLSDQRGAYVLPASAPGTYRLRALRIGFRPSLGLPFQLSDSTTVEHSITLIGLPVRLSETRISAAERCSSRADTSSLGFRAWEQARTALASAMSTREESGFDVDYVSTDRQWNDQNMQEVSYSQVEKHSSSVRTFHARPLSVLADSGYVIRHGEATTYAGPDEEILLSDEFATHHCISATPTSASDSIVLRFEPTSDRKLPDIRGALVLSSATAELRSLTFEYINVEPAELARGAGGRMSFLRLPGGGWVIREWAVITPVMVAVPRNAPFASLGGRFPVTGGESGPVVLQRVAMHETRGEIFRVTRGDERIWSAPMTSLRGRVTDANTEGQPDVVVRVLGARDSVVTDIDGRFVLGDIRAGDITLTLRPIDDSSAADTRLARVTASVDDSVPVRFEIPARRVTRADTRVAQAEEPSGSAAIAGVVRMLNGAPIAGADVGLTGSTQRGRTNANGEFSLGGFAAGTYEFEARQLGYAIGSQTVQLISGRTTNADVRLQRLVSLDSVNIVAQRSAYPEFEARRREAIDGKFLSEADVDRLHLQSTSDLVYAVSGFTTLGNGQTLKVLSARTAGLEPCETLILIDNVPVFRINEISPSLVGAVEFYPSFTGSPIQHRYGRQDTKQTAKCGTIVIWTKR